MLGAEMTPRRAQLLKQLVPQLTRLAFLWNRNNASHLAYLDEWRATVPKVDAQLTPPRGQIARATGALPCTIGAIRK
jgi:hypothetical protein